MPKTISNPNRLRVRLPTALELARARHLHISAASVTPEALAAQLRACPEFLTLDQRVAVPTIAIQSAPSVDKSLVVVCGEGSIDVDGYPVSVNPVGRIQLHALEDDPPAYALRASRGPESYSNNCCLVANVDATGISRDAHIVLDATELSLVENCGLQQYNGDAPALLYSNAPRRRDPSARASATNSGHLIIGGCICNYGTPSRGGPDRGACIRLAGAVDTLGIDRTWLAGVNDTAMVLVALPSEEWNDGGGGRWNIPHDITLDDCTSEGAYRIRLYHYEGIEVDDSEPGADPWKIVSAAMPNGERRTILTLRGKSCAAFEVTDGDEDVDLFEVEA